MIASGHGNRGPLAGRARLGRRRQVRRAAWTLWLSFAVFWVIQTGIIWRGMNAVRRFENWAAPGRPGGVRGGPGRRPCPVGPATARE